MAHVDIHELHVFEIEFAHVPELFKSELEHVYAIQMELLHIHELFKIDNFTYACIQ